MPTEPHSRRVTRNLLILVPMFAAYWVIRATSSVWWWVPVIVAAVVGVVCAAVVTVWQRPVNEKLYEEDDQEGLPFWFLCFRLALIGQVFWYFVLRPIDSRLTRLWVSAAVLAAVYVIEKAYRAVVDARERS